MDSLSLSLTILVVFVPLLVYFATAMWNEDQSDTVPKDALHSAFPTRRLQCNRARPTSREYAPVLKQNVAVARLMRMEGASLN